MSDNRGTNDGPDLGDLVIVLLAGTLAGLRDRLAQDEFPKAADLVARLVEEANGYLDSLESTTSSTESRWSGATELTGRRAQGRTASALTIRRMGRRSAKRSAGTPLHKRLGSLLSR